MSREREWRGEWEDGGWYVVECMGGELCKNGGWMLGGKWMDGWMNGGG